MERGTGAMVIGGVAAAGLVAVKALRHKSPQEPISTDEHGTITGGSISLDQATRLVDAAVRKARDLGIREDVAVVDAGGNLKAFARMDGAWLGSIDIAIRKAKTARLFDMPTADLGKKAQPGEALYGIEESNGGLITFGGGLPIRDSTGAVIGAIGASGSTVENDVVVAEAALQELH